MKILAPLLLLGLVACANNSSTETPDPVTTRGVEPTPLENLRAAVAEVAARPEHDAELVQVEHILLSFAGTGTSATRTMQEAEALAAELLVRIQAGEDFTALKVVHSDDGPGGIYSMVGEGPGDRSNLVFNRRDMVPAFGNTGWRLEVGQVGVAPYDARASKYGWHIVKRLQ